MKHILLIIFICKMFVNNSSAQNIGIGTTVPQKLLSINGSMLIDQGNQNRGALDSAALLFGTNSAVGISSNRSGIGANPNGLSLWTNNFQRLTLTQEGRVGINNTNPLYTLDVGGSANMGNLYVSTITSAGNITGNSLVSNFDVTVGDDLNVTDDAQVTGNMTIGGFPDLAYKLKVIGNGLYTSNVGIDGTLRVNGKITNDSKGLVLSNSATTLRTGFTSGAFSATITPSQFVDVTFCVATFTGNNNNIRVMVSQFVPAAGSSNWGGVVFTPHSVDASDTACSGGSSCKIRMQNTSSSNAVITLGSMLYLMAVVTD